jgi:predicted esterase
MTDRPSETRTTTQTLDLAELRDDVEREIAALEDGSDPYKGRAGDLWRTIRVGDADIPVRVYVPQRLAGASDAPMVIALHGAGGDENLFPDAYGAGVIKDLADERGFILVSPQTRFFVANPEVFRAVIDVMAECYDIDRARVFGVGHSLGAIALTSVASNMVDTLAGMACLAGPLVIRPPDSAPPTLLAAGELDPIAPPDRLARYASALQAAGVTVENVVYEDLGHTLMVNDALPDALQWLFALSPK